ncbi:MAG: molybdate ABC transporter substrate-binding protein [Planctomycetota bacterium]|nr:MAG: molybdate ABC transporter substrate-binding protein [Planctomycetota bacterium]
MVLLLSACGGPSGHSTTGPLRIAAASDLAFALPELIALYQQSHPGAVTTTLGSSGLLTRQIAQGAPYDVFFSANMAFIDDLVSDGHGLAASQALYGRGRIVLWSRRGGVAAPRSLEDLRDARFRRIALATPEHAPYGLAAKQALISAGLWEGLRPRLVYGENIKQAMQMAESGNAEVAIIALSLAIPGGHGDWSLIDERLHEALDQGLVITTVSSRKDAATAFVAAVTGPAGREILARYGFVLPGETLDPNLLEAAGGRVIR